MNSGEAHQRRIDAAKRVLDTLRSTFPSDLRIQEDAPTPGTGGRWFADLRFQEVHLQWEIRADREGFGFSVCQPNAADDAFSGPDQILESVAALLARSLEVFSNLPKEKVKAIKFDHNKTMWHNLQWHAFRKVAEVATAGGIKYGPDNWRSFSPDEARRRYTDALLRHLAAWLCGERFDPDSKQSHLAHVAWNALTLLEFEDGTHQPQPPPSKNQ